MFDFLYMHRRRIFVTLGFVCCYAGVCRRLRHSKIETVRLGIAGSLATMMCDCGFHIIDTVNIRAKVADGTVAKKSTFDQIRLIYAKEGAYGFGRGFSACFYGSIMYGLTYFYMYKTLKLKLFERFGDEISPTTVYFVSAMLAECVTILVLFPYDLIKCRI